MIVAKTQVCITPYFEIISKWMEIKPEGQKKRTYEGQSNWNMYLVQH